ncbi:vanadium-dependent haloperoxidase [Gilvibacter sp.]|uniref:vanadium-dependent haloperoxidase n=1 Tax=Gilvibacter sp. TaxID=2729997 RepID=UPI0025BAE6E1|nr:vanadium-dependent haloperoxidase [Gilvibacter sp.]
MKLNLMNRTLSLAFFASFLFLSLVACKDNGGDKVEDTPVIYEPLTVEAADFQSAADQVTQVMVHDIFSPPVASRIYAYPNVAAYEIMAQADPKYKSLALQLPGLTPVPRINNDTIVPGVAALVAHMEISKSLIFSEDMMQTYADSIYAQWEAKNPKQFARSKEYGLAVADHIKAWLDGDMYKQTRTMPKFTVDIDDPARWQPTPPAYMEGIEPHWNKIRPMVLDSAAQFKPKNHPKFSLEPGSAFYKELKEVYDISEEITASGDKSEEVEIAQYWDCNPYVSVTRGHLMFATKKITPGAHWMGIAKIACKQADADLNKTIYAYTKTSIALFDGFINCWAEKYRSNLVRPETLINKHIDENWEPILQTPPFPEYTSGHSVVSNAAATVLTDVFGDEFAFLDDTEMAYGLPARSFASFDAAAKEAAISRMYGGIHYRAAVENGIDQGKSVGGLVIEKLNWTNE